jgi:hypothetical protein
MKFHYEEMRIVLKTGSHPPSSNIRYERSWRSWPGFFLYIVCHLTKLSSIPGLNWCG